MLRTVSRRPTSVDSEPMYSVAPVAMRVRNSVALAQCTARSTTSNRTSRVAAGTLAGAPDVRRSPVSDGTVVTAVGLPDPPVDVVAEVLPIAWNDLGRDLNAVGPLARLVAVHGGHVHAHRAAVGVGDRLVLHGVGDHDVVAPGLLHGQALGVGAVEGREEDGTGPGVGAGGVEHVAQEHAGPRHRRHPPSG